MWMIIYSDWNGLKFFINYYIIIMVIIMIIVVVNEMM